MVAGADTAVVTLHPSAHVAAESGVGGGDQRLRCTRTHLEILWNCPKRGHGGQNGQSEEQR